MIRLARAKQTDLSAICELMQQARSKLSIAPEHLNRRDIGICARDSSGALVGFIWLGLMAGNTIAYIDKFAVSPAYAGKGVGALLAQEAFKQGKRLGVKECFGVIKQDEWHNASAMNALKMAMSARAQPYTYVQGQLRFMEMELAEV